MTWQPHVRLLVTALLTGTAFIAIAGLGQQITVLVKYEDGALQVTNTGTLVVPRHHAGSYVEWSNERDFARRQHLVNGTSYRVTAVLEQIEVRQFPEGWGARSGKYYSAYHLRAHSAARVEGNK